jgi:hypothetical protein
MNDDWKITYHAALRTQDPAELHEIFGQARRAINRRLFERGELAPNGAERQELEEALRQLIAHEFEIKIPPQ